MENSQIEEPERFEAFPDEETGSCPHCDNPLEDCTCDDCPECGASELEDCNCDDGRDEYDEAGGI